MNLVDMEVDNGEVFAIMGMIAALYLWAHEFFPWVV